MSKQKVIAIIGQTASGKSDLAVAIAKGVHGEVISADSRQVYRGFDTTTAKISTLEMKGVPHHLLDVADIEEEYTVAHFIADAAVAIDTISKMGKIPILAGGTGFYVDSLLNGVSLPQVPPNKKLREALEMETAQSLFEMLEAKDPVRAKNIESGNKQRLIRALEIVKFLGAVPALTHKSNPDYDVLWIGILWQKDALIERIHARVQKRIDAMIDEINEQKNRLTPSIANRLGFDFTLTLSYLNGAMNKEELINALTQKDSAYARRQMTWFKRNKQINWLTPDTLPSSAIELANGFIK